ncbi:hypothetical protein QFZ27_002999 [Inquilinus ginsengisoli]|uniref:hypothetical protein n=1 Tax=Inquilinus ginsengisoli TaxID=363840 RepID=UPI003D1C2037
MRISLVCGALIAFLMLGACQQAAKSPSVAAAEAAPVRDGMGTIIGRGILRMPNGTLLTCAGQRVRAYVETTDVALAVGKMSSPYMSAADLWLAILEKAERQEAKCDSSGYFSFANIPAGKWIVVGTVAWKVRDTGHGQFVLISNDVALKSGQKAGLLLSSSYCCSDGYAGPKPVTVDLATGRITPDPY